MRSRLLPVILAIAAVLALAQPLPPLSWTCPMHPEIVEGDKGACPICRMDLVPVRLDSIWSCALHSVVLEAKPGKCPICRRDLVPVTVAVTWTCPDRHEGKTAEHLDPGTCPDGSARAIRYAPRAHGNHNPQHGGLFFMAGDNWHHLEGTYPAEGVFRLHLYDDFSRPLPIDKVQQASGRVVVKETFDSATRTTREESAFPLRPGLGSYLDAKIDPLAPPAQMIAKVRFDAQGPEYRFDFAFPEFSKETTLDASALVASGVDASQIPVEVPDKAEDVMAQLRIRSDQMRTIIDRGTFGDLYIPALQAKDLALALDVHARALAPDRRARVAGLVKQIVLGAWRLDAFGDQGDRRQIAGAFDAFSAAVADLETVFVAPPRK